MTVNDRNCGQEKHPIYPADIERCRKRLKTGQQVRIRVLEWDLDFRHRILCRECVVEEKHRWLFMARDRRGKRYVVTYVDLLIQGGA